MMAVHIELTHDSHIKFTEHTSFFFYNSIQCICTMVLKSRNHVPGFFVLHHTISGAVYVDSLNMIFRYM